MGNEFPPSTEMLILLYVALIVMCLLFVALGKRCMAFHYQVSSTDTIRKPFRGKEGSTYKEAGYWSQGGVSLPTL